MGLIEQEILRQIEEAAKIAAPEGASASLIIEASAQRNAAMVEIARNMARALMVADSLLDNPQSRLIVYAALIPVKVREDALAAAMEGLKGDGIS